MERADTEREGDIVVEHHDRLLHASQSLYALEAFERELERASKGRLFFILNDIVWAMALRSRDLTVIHLASFAKSLYTKGGLLGRLQAGSPKSFPRRRKGAQGEGRPERDYLDRLHREAFERLFPNAARGLPSHADWGGLIDRYGKCSADLVSDRNNNRAHPYERGSTASARVLCVAELRKHVAETSALLNDLRLLQSGSTMELAELHSASASTTARTLVDMVLLGTCCELPDARRSAIYEALHSQTPRAASEEQEAPFNPHEAVSAVFEADLFARAAET
jgi:hypothetical protein